MILRSVANEVRFGALGAARITPPALVEPASRADRCRLVAVAARDPERARDFARRNDVPEVSESYAALVERTDIDAVYIGLPASHHAQWTLEALRAGKHVLCEKPFATSESEAREMVALASERGLVLAEAFHYYYHPYAQRVNELCTSGAIGTIEHMEGRFNAPIGDLDDIRYQLELGGGATMDLGCYSIHWMRMAAAAEPEIVSAKAVERPAGVDEAMTAELRFPSGATGQLDCSMAKPGRLVLAFDVRGSAGSLTAVNLLAPHLGHELIWRDASGEHREKFEGVQTTFDHQLLAFVAAVLDGESLPTAGPDAIGNMRAIDSIYAAAGLPPRRS